MSEGWKRGARGIDGNKGSDFLNRGTEDGKKSPRDISTRELKQACDPWDEPTWKPGKVSSGGKWHSGNGPPNSPSNTRPVEAASPTGRFAKRGGTGKGFGS